MKKRNIKVEIFLSKHLFWFKIAQVFFFITVLKNSFLMNRNQWGISQTIEGITCLMLKLNECVRFAYSSYWANAFQIANCLFFERKRGFLVTFFTVIVSSWTSSFCRGRFLGQVLPRLETGLISYSSKNPKSTRFDSFRCPNSSQSSILFLHPV